MVEDSKWKIGPRIEDLPIEGWQPFPDGSDSLGKIIADRFEQLAVLLENPSGDYQSSLAKDETGRVAVVYCLLLEEAGKLIAEAYHRGFLQDIPGLGDLIAWHFSPEDRTHLDLQAFMAKCGANLLGQITDIFYQTMGQSLAGHSGRIVVQAFGTDEATIINPQSPVAPDARVQACRILASMIQKQVEDESHLSRAESPKIWAKRFGCCTKTFIKQCENGKIPHKKISDRAYRVDIRVIPGSPKEEISGR